MLKLQYGILKQQHGQEMSLLIWLTSTNQLKVSIHWEQKAFYYVSIYDTIQALGFVKFNPRRQGV